MRDFSFIRVIFSKIDKKNQKNYFLFNFFLIIDICNNLQVHSSGAYLQQLVTWLPLRLRLPQDQFWAEEVLSFPPLLLLQGPFQDPLCQPPHLNPKWIEYSLPHLNHKIEYSLTHHKVNLFILHRYNIWMGLIKKIEQKQFLQYIPILELEFKNMFFALKKLGEGALKLVSYF